uniref:Uncharacterized protein n=1 Tax=Oryzias sinensis TaxID=183150 RepID=A0A8C7ZP38_9TELE
MLILPLLVDLQNAVLGLHHQLLRGMVEQGPHLRAHERCPHITRPVGVGERGEVLVQGRHAEPLVEEPADLVPRVPAGGAVHGEGDVPLCHVSVGAMTNAAVRR